MVRSTFFFGVLTLLAGLELSGSASAANDNTPLPRYRLEVGQELTYIGKSDFKFKDLGQRDRDDAQSGPF